MTFQNFFTGLVNPRRNTEELFEKNHNTTMNFSGIHMSYSGIQWDSIINHITDSPHGGKMEKFGKTWKNLEKHGEISKSQEYREYKRRYEIRRLHQVFDFYKKYRKYRSTGTHDWDTYFPFPFSFSEPVLFRGCHLIAGDRFQAKVHPYSTVGKIESQFQLIGIWWKNWNDIFGCYSELRITGSQMERPKKM